MEIGSNERERDYKIGNYIPLTQYQTNDWIGLFLSLSRARQ